MQVYRQSGSVLDAELGESTKVEKRLVCSKTLSWRVEVDGAMQLCEKLT